MMDLKAGRAELNRIASAIEEDILIWNERRMLERREQAAIAKLAKSMSGDLTEHPDLVKEMFARMDAMEKRGPLPAPPHRAIKLTPAGGKSRQLRRMIASFIRRAKEAGLPHRVLFLVPTHDLAAEAAKDIAPDIEVMIWQGLAADALPDKKVKMCLNLKAVKAAVAVGATVQSSVCRYKDAECPFFRRCQYQRQRATVGAADVVFAAHEILFSTPDTFGEFGLVVIDESFWQAGLKGINPRISVEIANLDVTLGKYPVRVGGAPCDEHTQILREMIECLQGALKNEPDGYVRRAPLEAAGLRLLVQNKAGEFRHAIHLEWARKVDTGIRPHVDVGAMLAAALIYGPFLGKMSARAAVWHELEALLRSGEEATGRLALETVDGRRCLRILQRRKVSKELLALPIVVADATLPFEIARHFLPDLRLACDIEIEAPHQNIVVVTGVPVGKLSTRPRKPNEPQRKPKEEARVAEKRQRLADLVRLWLPGPRKLVITYQDIEEDFGTVAETAHWNAFEGRNEWEDVDSVVVIGRPMPHGTAISAMAAALTGRPVDAGDGVKRGRVIRDAAGTDHRVQCWTYAGCPEAEMIRAAIVETAIVQAVGRARGINRRVLDPVEVVLILNDVAVPGLPVDAVVKIEDLRVALMIDAGIVPKWPSDAHKLYGELFISKAAAKLMYGKTALSVKAASGLPVQVVSALRETPLKADTTYASSYAVRYRNTASGVGSRLAWVDPAKVPDPRAVLEAALGPLVEFEMLPQPYRPLSAWRIRGYAEAYIAAGAVQMEETGDVDHEVLQADLRTALAGNGFPPLAVAAELERILTYVFEVPGRPPLDDWVMVEPGLLPCWTAISVGLAA